MTDNSFTNVPKHIAFIMDGNGRWAQNRKKLRSFGHKEGLEHLRNVMQWCTDIGVKMVTAYVFSTENWNRPKKEVNALMNIIRERGKSLAHELHENDVQIRHLGSRKGVPTDVLEVIDYSVGLTRENKKHFVNIAYNYGGRQEIVSAIKSILSGRLSPEEVAEEVVDKSMYGGGEIPDPDLLVRTGGESRLSNFLLWQVVDCVFYITPVLWPDFSKEDLSKAVGLYIELSTKRTSSM